MPRAWPWRGATVYVADGSSGLRIVNVANPAAPVEVGFYDTLGEAGNVVVAESYAHVADGAGGLLILRFASGEDVSITACKQSTEGAAVKDWLMTLAGPEQKSGQTLADGCITWTVTQPGAYTVTEEDQAGWTHQGATSADFTVVSGGGPYSHTFVNFQDVPITACKQDTEGAAVKDWLMTLAGPEPKSGQTLANGCITWTVTKPGAYTVTEADQAGWTIKVRPAPTSRWSPAAVPTATPSSTSRTYRSRPASGTWKVRRSRTG